MNNPEYKAHSIYLDMSPSYLWISLDSTSNTIELALNITSNCGLCCCCCCICCICLCCSSIRCCWRCACCCWFIIPTRQSKLLRPTCRGDRQTNNGPWLGSASVSTDADHELCTLKHSNVYTRTTHFPLCSSYFPHYH